jgi:hypothetical protein
MIDGLDTSNLDERLDWTEKGAANAIKDQKSCGSCWAFSTTANLEGAGFVATGVLASLSEQQLVDCDKNGDMGCSGGLPTNAFGWMKKGHALTDDTSYPYKARGQTCKSSGMKDVTKIKGYSMISKNEDQIAAALATYGPLSIGIDASKFNSYRSGVMTGSCGTRLDHGVAIVGYGVLSGTQYWEIRNSWGKSWGESGYIRIIRGKGECGLNTDVSTATGITVDGTPPAPTPVPTPVPTPTPTPSGFTCDQCQAQGHAKDACNCGVCGSFGLCSFSCSPGGGRVACDKVLV